MYFFSYDSLTIYDGGSSTSPLVGKYCGDTIPPSHFSSSNEILIHFQTDGGEARAGFKIEYNPTGKQITSIQNNNEYYKDWCRILVTFFLFRYLYSLFRKVIKIAYFTKGGHKSEDTVEISRLNLICLIYILSSVHGKNKIYIVVWNEVSLKCYLETLNSSYKVWQLQRWEKTGLKKLSHFYKAKNCWN